MIRPAAPGAAKALAALSNHWLEATAVTFSPAPKASPEAGCNLGRAVDPGLMQEFL